MKYKNALVFGAGSIGRGFIGELLSMSNFKITFIDINECIIDGLNEKGRYEIELVTNQGNSVKDIFIEKAINGNDESRVLAAFEEADLIFTAVGKNALKYIANPVAQGLRRRSDCVNIILCENMVNAHLLFREMVKDHLNNKADISRVGFIRASVGRMVPVPDCGAENLKIKAEPYYSLPIDADAIIGELPDFAGCEKISPFEYMIERKLYIHNLGHAAFAWMGQKKGYSCIYEAATDDDIKKDAYGAMNEAAVALSRKYNIKIDILIGHINDLILRFGNKELNDTIPRVGKDTLRKLSANDRAIGALRLCIAQNCPYDEILKVIAAGMVFKNDDEGTIKVQQLRYELGDLECLQKISDLRDNKVSSRIIQLVNNN